MTSFFVLRYERLLGHTDVEEIDDVDKAFARLFELEHETAHLDDVEGVLLSALRDRTDPRPLLPIGRRVERRFRQGGRVWATDHTGRCSSPRPLTAWRLRRPLR